MVLWMAFVISVPFVVFMWMKRYIENMSFIIMLFPWESRWKRNMPYHDTPFDSHIFTLLLISVNSFLFCFVLFCFLSRFLLQTHFFVLVCCKNERKYLPTTMPFEYLHILKLLPFSFVYFSWAMDAVPSLLYSKSNLARFLFRERERESKALLRFQKRLKKTFS